MMNALRALLAVLGLLSGASWGHEGRPVYVEVQQQSIDGYRVKWKIPPVMTAGQEPVISLLGDQCAPYCPSSALKSTDFMVGQSGIVNRQSQRRRGSLIGRLDYRCAANTTGLAVEIAYPGSNPGLTSLLIYSPLAGPQKQIFSGPERTQVPLLDNLSGGQVAREYSVAGIQHILSGYDHLAFVVCLMMMAGSARRLLLTVTGFTLAHSITLSLATLGWVRLPSALVETLIALSILLLAVELHRHILGGRAGHDGGGLGASRASVEPAGGASPVPDASSFTWRYPILTAALFGLLHGFGFASVLQDLGLPDDLMVPALLFFNLGVELGQLAFIAVVLSLVWVAWRSSAWLRAHLREAQTAIIFVLGSVSALWFIERLLSW
jgi:hydrogenase/urease accessory protein HupE